MEKNRAYLDDLRSLLKYFSNPGVSSAAATSKSERKLGLPLLRAEEKYDLIASVDSLSNEVDIQSHLFQLKTQLNADGRILLTCYNIYLRPFYSLAEKLGLKEAGPIVNWLSESDVENFCELCGFDVVQRGTRGILPWHLLGLGRWLNRWLAPLPIFKFTNLYGYFLLRPQRREARKISSVSVIVPARNEAGNIPAALSRLPRLAPKVELIFVEGNSTDNTWDAIQTTLRSPHPDWVTMKAFRQPGKGKADAVHVGFAQAAGEILMILDADLTMPPEELPRFLEPIERGIADFTHGSRLVYPMEGEAMRFLNILGNKFFSLAFSFVLGQRFKDTLCGTKVFYRHEWQRILDLRRYFGDFDPFGDFEMLFGSTKLGHKILEIPVHYKARTYGETNISRFTHGWILLKMVVFAATRMKFIPIASERT